MNNTETDTTAQPRPLRSIATEIRTIWAKVNYAAEPYLEAMEQLDSIDDRYYQDTARDIVRRFLSNASAFRGEDARRLKAELKTILGD